MGTQKHSDYVVSKEEAERRQARWDQTTSKSLGVRVCGMKVSISLVIVKKIAGVRRRSERNNFTVYRI